MTSERAQSCTRRAPTGRCPFTDPLSRNPIGCRSAAPYNSHSVRGPREIVILVGDEALRILLGERDYRITETRNSIIDVVGEG